MLCSNFLLCNMLGRMSMRSTDGVPFMAFDLSRSTRIYAQEKETCNARCHALPCCCLHAVVHMMLSTCSPVGASASFQPASQPACAFSQSASSILARRCASSVQFSSVQLSVIGYRLLVIGYQLSVRMLLSACHSSWTRVFEHVRSPSQFDVEVQSRVWQPCSA